MDNITDIILLSYYLFSARVRVGEYDLDKEKEGEQDCDEEGYCAPLPQVWINNFWPPIFRLFAGLYS